MRRALGTAVRVLFVGAVIAFAVWGFWDDWPLIGETIAGTAAWRIVAALALAGAGLALTLPVWMVIASSFGHPLSTRSAAQVLFPGQLGKYIPGSVWSVGAQMQLARKHDIPLRVSGGIGLTFIGVSLATSGFVAGVMAATGAISLPTPWWLGIIAAVGFAAALSPWFLRRVGVIVAGRDAAPLTNWRSSATIMALMLASWAVWAGSVWVLLPRVTWADYPLVVGAMSLAYAAGLIVVIAPAGIGVREAVLVALLAPEFGVPIAASVALLSRVAAAIVDFAAAGIATVAAKRRNDELEPERELASGRLG